MKKKSAKAQKTSALKEKAPKEEDEEAPQGLGARAYPLLCFGRDLKNRTLWIIQKDYVIYERRFAGVDSDRPLAISTRPSRPPTKAVSHNLLFQSERMVRSIAADFFSFCFSFFSTLCSEPLFFVLFVGFINWSRLFESQNKNLS